MLTRDGRREERVEMRPECVRGLPESAGIPLRWHTKLARAVKARQSRIGSERTQKKPFPSK